MKSLYARTVVILLAMPCQKINIRSISQPCHFILYKNRKFVSKVQKHEKMIWKYREWQRFKIVINVKMSKSINNKSRGYTWHMVYICYNTIHYTYMYSTYMITSHCTSICNQAYKAITFITFGIWSSIIFLFFNSFGLCRRMARVFFFFVCYFPSRIYV